MSESWDHGLRAPDESSAITGNCVSGGAHPRGGKSPGSPVVGTVAHTAIKAEANVRLGLPDTQSQLFRVQCTIALLTGETITRRASATAQPLGIKPGIAKQPGLLDTLDELVHRSTMGTPMVGTALDAHVNL